MGSLEIDAPADRAAAGTRRVGNVKAVLVVNIFAAIVGRRRLHGTTVGQAFRIQSGVGASPRVELVKFRQRANAQNSLRIRISLSICARERIERSNPLPKVF